MKPYPLSVGTGGISGKIDRDVNNLDRFSAIKRKGH
jgi:hypothetical protein